MERERDQEACVLLEVGLSIVTIHADLSTSFFSVFVISVDNYLYHAMLRGENVFPVSAGH